MKIGDNIRTLGTDEDNKGYGCGSQTVGKIKHYKIDSFDERGIVALNKNRCREYFNYADVIAPSGRVLQIKEKGEWRNITKEDLKESGK